MKVPERAQELIASLKLQPHPEGGFYKEMYRSTENIPGKERSLMTSIYFLIYNDNVSHLHRITADEAWYFHEGDPLVVHTLTKEGHGQFVLGTDLTAGQRPYYLVPGGTIFGSCLLNDCGYTLVSCAVAPGFDFRDFELFERDVLLAEFPHHKEIICKLT